MARKSYDVISMPLTEKRSVDLDNGNDLEPDEVSLDDFEGKLPMAREQWANKAEFILSCIGYAVGLGNVWRFPYLCYKNGGGAFLIPYVICVLCAGIPLFFMEIALGQFMSRAGWEVWRICPLFQGISVASVVLVFLESVYYIVILAWAAYYFSQSLTTVLPWSHCNNTWNTPGCFDSNSGVSNNSTHPSADPVVEFWERKILQISDGIDEPGGIVWELALCLLFTWIICYFCVWKGVKSTGKVVYFSATFPYVMIVTLLIRGATLPGAVDGVIYYLKPDFSRLASPQVWIDAGTQIFYSYAIGLGALTALGSYSKFNNNCYKDCIFISIVNSGTSFLAGFAIFSVLGYMAFQQGVSIDNVVASGPGLAFIAYPKAIAHMPVAPLWACLFFFMIILLGLDSQFVMCESLITFILDMRPELRRGYGREIVIAIFFSVAFLLGLCMVTRGGMYVFQLFDYYAASGISLLFIVFCEVVAIAWVYGAERFYGNIQVMIGYRISPWMKICWLVLAPVAVGGIGLFGVIKFEVLKYGGKPYPDWATGVGFSLAGISMIQIPIFAVYNYLRTPGTVYERMYRLTNPTLRPQVVRRISRVSLYDIHSVTSILPDANTRLFGLSLKKELRRGSAI